MHAYWTLVRREMSGYFFSMTGYVIIAAAMLLLATPLRAQENNGIQPPQSQLPVSPQDSAEPRAVSARRRRPRAAPCLSGRMEWSHPSRYPGSSRR